MFHSPPNVSSLESRFVGYSGVSSFGFGGANARADVFAIASRGPRKPKKVGNHERKLVADFFLRFLFFFPGFQLEFVKSLAVLDKVK